MESSAADHDALTSILDRCNRDRVASILGATPQKWTSEGEVYLAYYRDRINVLNNQF